MKIKCQICDDDITEEGYTYEFKNRKDLDLCFSCECELLIKMLDQFVNEVKLSRRFKREAG